MQACRLEDVRAVVDEVFVEGLEGLRRLPVEERLELWNRLVEAHRAVRRCASRLLPETRRLVMGEVRLAQLLVAASLRGLGYPEITGLFKDEEYEIIEDFESMKELDYYDVDTMVEMIRRREGRVWEIVKKYYEKQYNVLDRSWRGLLGDLLYAIETRYRERRAKIEEAVKKYIERYGLLTTVEEIAEAVRKTLEVRGDVRRAEEALEEGRLEEAERLLSRLAERERELEELRERLRGEEEARRLLEEELERLRGELARLREERELLEMERRALLEGGRGGGHPVSREEALLLAASYAEKVAERLRGEVAVSNPVRGRAESYRFTSSRARMERGSTVYEAVVWEAYGGVLRRRKRAVVEVVSVYHRTLLERGFDAEPAGLGDIAWLVRDRVEASRAGGYYHVLILVSPTGWTRKAVEAVEKLYTSTASVYLVDPVAQRIYYNRGLRASEENLGLVEPVAREEAVAKALDYLLSREAVVEALRESPARPMLTLGRLVEKTGVDAATARLAMERAAERGYGRVVEAGGATAFAYSEKALSMASSRGQGEVTRHGR